MSEKIVVYYSRTGTAKKSAEKLAEALGCEATAIISQKNFMGLIGWFSAARTSMAEKSVNIVEPEIKPENYETVIICAPIWAGKLASPAREWLVRNQNSCKNIAFLFTSGGGDSTKTIHEIESLTGEKNVFENLSNTDRKSEAWIHKIKDFATKL